MDPETIDVSQLLITFYKIYNSCYLELFYLLKYRVLIYAKNNYIQSQFFAFSIVKMDRSRRRRPRKIPLRRQTI